MRVMTGKCCFLSRRRGRGAMCRCGTWPGAHPCLPARRPLSPIGYKAAPAMASISCFLSRGRARYITRLPTVTQLEDGGRRGASRWVVASRFSGQEALLKNKAGLCFFQIQKEHAQRGREVLGKIKDKSIQTLAEEWPASADTMTGCFFLRRSVFAHSKT